MILKMECKDCGDQIAPIRWVKNHCSKHFRFRAMRISARSRRVYVPSLDELEDLYDEVGVICPACGITMNWFSNGNRKQVISLQHDRSGDITFLCQSCNARHVHFPGDEYYDRDRSQDNNSDHVRCTQCLIVKPRAQFYKDMSNRDGIRSDCKACLMQRHQTWRENNRDKVALQAKRSRANAKARAANAINMKPARL